MSDISYAEELLNNMMQLRKLAVVRMGHSHKEKAATMLQLAVLNFLKDRSGGSIGDLAEVLGLSKSSATQLVERLVKLGLLKKTEDKNDRRVVRLEITVAGEKERVILRKKIITKMDQFIAKIPEKDIKELIRIQNDLITVLKKEEA